MEKYLTSSFDYSLLDVETSNFLYEKENILIGIQSRYSREVGKVFFEAQQKLSNKGNGTFEKWYSSIGFKKQNVNNYINIYKNVQSLDEPSAEIFDSLPKSLQNEMSKPSSNQELNKKVFEGDITTHKQYKELEKQLKQQAEQHQRQLAQKDEVINKTYEQLEKVQQQEPKVIEKEVIPEDYEDLKRTKDYLTKRNEHLEKEHQDLLNQRKEVNEKSQKYDQLTEAIHQSEGKLNQVQQRIADYNALHKVLKEGNDLLAKISVLVYTELSDAVTNDTLIKRELETLLSRFLKLNSDIRKKINNNTLIIEGEIIDD